MSNHTLCTWSYRNTVNCDRKSKTIQKIPRFSFPGNVKKLGDTYPTISQARNAELRLRWGQIVLKNDHQEEFWKVRDFLQSQVGARVRPVGLWARGACPRG